MQTKSTPQIYSILSPTVSNILMSNLLSRFKHTDIYENTDQQYTYTIHMYQ